MSDRVQELNKQVDNYLAELHRIDCEIAEADRVIVWLYAVIRYFGFVSR